MAKKKEPIFAEDVTSCPNCGSTEFWMNWITSEYLEIMWMDCTICGSIFYGKEYYKQHFGKDNHDYYNHKYSF